MSFFDFLMGRKPPYLYTENFLNILGVARLRMKGRMPRFWTRAGIADAFDGFTNIRVEAKIKHSIEKAPYGIAAAGGIMALGTGVVVSAGIYEERGVLVQCGFTLTCLGFMFDMEFGINTPIEFAQFWKRNLTPNPSLTEMGVMQPGVSRYGGVYTYDSDSDSFVGGVDTPVGEAVVIKPLPELPTGTRSGRTPTRSKKAAGARARTSKPGKK